MEFLNSDISAKSIIDTYKPKPVPVMKRGQWLNQFYYKLSQDWNGVDPLTRLRVGIAMKRFQDWELPVLWKLCDTSESFAKCFWWKVKTKPIPPRVKRVKNLTLKLK